MKSPTLAAKTKNAERLITEQHVAVVWTVEASGSCSRCGLAMRAKGELEDTHVENLDYGELDAARAKVRDVVASAMGQHLPYCTRTEQDA